MWDIIQTVFAPLHLLMMNIGLAAGIMMGAMPGLSLTFTITVILPLTFGLGSLPGMFMLLGAYAGGMYGGSITAILINTPGTSNAAATVFDGYPLARQGRAGDALKAALFSSVIGGLFSAFMLLFFAPLIAKAVLKIQSPEYFSLCIFGMMTSIGVAGKNKLRGVMSAAIGLFVSTIGMDGIFATPRLMFGNYNLLGGVQTSTAMLGAYALSQVLIMAREAYVDAGKTGERIQVKKATLRMRDILKYRKTLLRSSLVGTLIGAIPGTGGATSAMFCYNEARRASKEPEKFGTGSIEGIVAAECGNNAVTGATMIPMLTLGIPGDSITAILLGALMMQGVTPGARLFERGNIWVYAIMGGLFLINLFLLFQGVLFSRGFANISRVPKALMVPCIITVCCMGAFAIGNKVFEIYIMVAFGLIGYLLKRFSFPIPPLTIGIVLGSLLETNLRRSLTLSQGNPLVFFTRPLSLSILIFSFVMLLLPDIKKWRAKRKQTRVKPAKGGDA